MARIIYLLPTQGAIQGGHKIIVRHVEALRALGFDAYCGQGEMHRQPNWLEHSAPFIVPSPLYPDDVVVAPDDADKPLLALLKASCRLVVLTQNPFYLALKGFGSLDKFPSERFPTFIAVSEGLRSLLQRAYPDAECRLVPCFADERIFRPQPKTLAIGYAPKKRPLEVQIIRELSRKLHPRHADIRWVELDRMREAEVAGELGRVAVFLSLSRLESVGMTTLEAMACRCLCAGFTGVGGALEYATPENGLWVADDDCIGAADALARALDMVRGGTPEVEGYLAAGQRTAEAWSYARFVEALERTWSELAPAARTL